VLAFQTGSAKSQLVWFDRTGKRLEPVAEPDNYATVVLAPDGRRAATGLLDADGRQSDVWLIDLTRGTKARLTFDAQSDGDPIWSPDGKRIVFSSNRSADAHIHLYDTGITSTGGEQLLLSGNADDVPTSWSPDGKHILFTRFQSGSSGSVWSLATDNREAHPLLQSAEFEIAAAVFSPSGRFIAYSSDESGRSEVYVQPFPLTGEKWVISAGGGHLPLWRGDGRELFYINGDGKIMSAQINSDGGFDSVVTKQLFQADLARAPGYPYAVAPDGSRFLINAPAEAANPAPMTIVLNWPATVK
jgi:Tol biopolymer transport system component